MNCFLNKSFKADDRVEVNKSMDDIVVDFIRSMDNDFLRACGARKFSYDDVVIATNNFSEKARLGEGGFGAVYRGFLRELNCYVAVKRMSRDSRQGIKEYAAEVKIISQLRHRNIVHLIGWCHEKMELLLVYEFMANGSLDSHLFYENRFLKWNARFKIALGLASGLLYLHEEREQYVVHRDIKTSNVMLDSKFNAKLGDFGLARLVDHGKGLDNTSLAGTIGYMAPEYSTKGKASKESDVYSFGIVALEIACGRKVIDHKATREDRIYLRDWVWSLYGGGKMLEAADPRLNGFDEQQLECLMTVGLWCAHPDAKLRPTMEKAIHVLNFVAPLPALPLKMPTPSYSSPISMSSGVTDLEEGHKQSPTVGYNSTKRNSLEQKRLGHKRFLKGTAFGLWKCNKGKKEDKDVKMSSGSSTSSYEEKENNDFEMSSAPFMLAYEDLVLAANNFSKQNKLWEGRFGLVYKAFMKEFDSYVAVERASKGSTLKEQTVISMCSKLRHRHVVSLIGYAMNDREMILVYEYMAQGTLRDHLYRTKKSPLPWKQRLHICSGAARGLFYLHSGTENIIIHRDIRSSNILLDHTLVARVSDFWLSMEESYTYGSTMLKGSVGYLDPEYFQRQKHTEKSDVYSFGVVLFEVLCGRPAIDSEERDLEKISLAEWALKCYEMGNLDQIIDPYLKGKIAPKCFKIFTDIAISCLAYRGSERPAMADVLWSLELAIQHQDDSDRERI